MSRAFPLSIPHAAPRAYNSAEELLIHAAEHARNRLLHACEAISWVGGLALGANGVAPTFSITGAQVQDARAGDGEQAAHVLVGQILIDGRPPWTYVTSESKKVAWLARFMVTSAVPTAFNTADSAAESAGLKEAFRQACESAWTTVALGSANLVAVYNLFLEGADAAFQRAELNKQGKRTAASSSGNTRASEDRFIEGLILRAYRLHGVTGSEANRLFPLDRAGSSAVV